jgi:Zn ribbon nucleic-acid-binding protein
MSKQVSADVPCPKCGQYSEISLYRSIWIEYSENRKLIFDNKINLFTCQKCGHSTSVPFSLLATNIKKHIAVWYEPYPDTDVENDIKLYAQHFGAGSFYATAPRIKDWEEFKKKIIELEGKEEVKSDLAISPEMQDKMRGFIGSIKKQRKKPWWQFW